MSKARPSGLLRRLKRATGVLDYITSRRAASKPVSLADLMSLTKLSKSQTLHLLAEMRGDGAKIEHADGSYTVKDRGPY